MRSFLVTTFFTLSFFAHADRLPSYTPVHSYEYDYTCIMDYGDGKWRPDDGIVINFPSGEKPLDVGVVDDGDLRTSLDCSLRNSDEGIALSCTFSRVGFEISIKPDLSGTMAVIKSGRTDDYSLSCRDNR